MNTFCICADGLKHFLVSFMEKIDIQDFVCFYENANYRLWSPLQNACCHIQEAGCNSLNCFVSRRLRWILKRVTRYYFLKSQADDWLSAFSNAELRFPVPFEGPPVLEILMRIPVKSLELISVFIEASRNLKVLFFTIKMQNN